MRKRSLAPSEDAIHVSVAEMLRITGQKPASQRPRERDEVHLSVAKALTILVARPGEASRYGVVWYSVDHGHSMDMRKNRRGVPVGLIEAKRRKDRGVVRGIADLHFYHHGRTLKIELKRDAKKNYTPEQNRLRAALAVAGIPTELCWSIDGVLAALSAHGIPHSASSHTEALLAEAGRLHVAAVGGA